ncbi:hypothetical protein M9H77_27176 [Catharanthus roseus]|uniref:Uncharacterized protein n=1 Tax=Catharanthus roseus TaxID=4058 RepID=A0ACC0AEH8_CATRO|nr:hypothetical protein M9H77_27176 [Catharanthus roseus]
MGCYRVKKFHGNHNHVLANPRAIHFLRFLRNVSTLGISEAQSMRAIGIGIPQIVDYQSHQCGGYRMRSTQKLESLNAFACTYLKSRLLLYPFVDKFEMVISKLRQKELEEEYFTSQTTTTLLTHLKGLEARASKVFTRNIFSKVQWEVVGEATFSIHDMAEMDEMKLYTITQYLHEGHLWKVEFHKLKSVI